MTDPVVIALALWNLAIVLWLIFLSEFTRMMFRTHDRLLYVLRDEIDRLKYGDIDD